MAEPTTIGTIIAFEGDHWVVVRETYEEVAATLTPDEWAEFTAIDDGSRILVRERDVRVLREALAFEPEAAPVESQA